MNVDPTLIFLGLLMPLIVAFAKQSGFSKTVNSIIALVVYVAACGLWLVQRNIPITLESLTTNAAALTIIGYTAYKMVWDALYPGGDTPPNNDIKAPTKAPSLDAVITDATSISRFKRHYVKPIILANEKFAH